MRKRKYLCPAELTLGVLGSKWRVIVFWNLRKAPRTFNALKRLAPGITATALSATLKHFVEAGIVDRDELESARGEVQYSLTPLGRSLDGVIRPMVRWGIENHARFVIGPFGMDRR